MSEVLQGNIAKYILRQSGVLLLGVLMMASFMLIDVYFISQLGSRSLTAVSYATPVMTLLVSMLLGVGAGMVVVVANAAGGNDHKKLHSLLISCISFAFIFGLMLWIILFMGSRNLFVQLGARKEVLTQLMQYFEIMIPGMFFLCLLVAVTSLARALGNHKLLTYTMLLLVIINALLDPLLIFGYAGFPRLGIAGAAWATTIAIFISMWLPVPYLWKALKRYKHTDWSFARIFRWRPIVAMAFPIALTNVLVPLGNTLFVKLLSHFGNAAVSAYGAGSRVDMLAIFSFTSLTAVLAPFIGQNLGAEERTRAHKGLQYGITYAFILGLLAAVFISVFREHISRIFATDAATFRALNDYLKIVPWGYAMNGFVMISLTVLNVYQRPWLAMGLALCHLFLFYLPIAYGAMLMNSFDGILAAYPISHLLATLLSYVILNKVSSRKMLELEFSG
ncbi:MATE family efflux transporter [Catalinimonas niigatensis]|uniref:MATE family efflux transporter n=1 Tax=Catalinimonas niigatensis TaxID=1397264 RepID=UPI002664E76D|nr:MATE family efflux transporter [Catalinimonas niigatensis]WPP51650.1 MATE family efflux transporter [Catalinimonas niigatensis]